MAIRNILIYGHPILRIKTRQIEDFDGSLQTLAGDMIETMLAAEGIVLSGPQVGESLSIVVVDLDLIVPGSAPKAYINPEILADSGSTVMEEGCLSIPDIRENVQRAEQIKVRYRDLDGKLQVEEPDGMLARVLLHEIDHLNGVLFVDRISSIRRSLLSKRLKQLASGA
jgi:peptide deformylase